MSVRVVQSQGNRWIVKQRVQRAEGKNSIPPQKSPDYPFPSNNTHSDPKASGQICMPPLRFKSGLKEEGKEAGRRKRERFTSEINKSSGNTFFSARSKSKDHKRRL